jgi:branched-chain amino acid transport system ATP-binding protein
MEQGRITFTGTPGQLAEDEVIQRAYLGTRRTPADLNHGRGR